MNLYLTPKEEQCLRDVCTQWIELMESGDEDLVTPMLNDGLGSVLYKLYKGKNGEIAYKEYAPKSPHESEELNALLGKRVKIVLFDNTIHTGILGKSEYSDRYKLNRQEMNKGNLTFYKTHIKKIEEIGGIIK